METPEQKMSRGHTAKTIMNNPVMQEAFEAVEAHLWHKWRTSNDSSFDAREHAYKMLRALDELKTTLTSYINTGSFEEVKLQDQIKAGGGTAANT